MNVISFFCRSLRRRKKRNYFTFFEQMATSFCRKYILCYVQWKPIEKEKAGKMKTEKEVMSTNS